MNSTVHRREGSDVPRFVTAEDLRARLGKEIDALRETEDALYVLKRGRLAAVVLDSERYAELLERLDYLEDSVAAFQARGDRDASFAWADVRDRKP